MYKKFTLIELMFTIMILIAIMGISFVAGNKVLRASAKQKDKAVITMMMSAVSQYKDRYGALPKSANYNGVMDFPQYFSSMPPNVTITGQRPMWIDFQASDIQVYTYTVSGSSYKTTGSDLAGTISNGTVNINNLSVADSYDVPFKYIQTDNLYEIRSAGVDGVWNTLDDVSSND